MRKGRPSALSRNASFLYASGRHVGAGALDIFGVFIVLQPWQSQ
jgi:hypothetical protein